jgi:hypothetical protein
VLLLLLLLVVEPFLLLRLFPSLIDVVVCSKLLLFDGLLSIEVTDAAVADLLLLFIGSDNDDKVFDVVVFVDVVGVRIEDFLFSES